MSMPTKHIWNSAPFVGVGVPFSKPTIVEVELSPFDVLYNLTEYKHINGTSDNEQHYGLIYLLVFPNNQWYIGQTAQCTLLNRINPRSDPANIINDYNHNVIGTWEASGPPKVYIVEKKILINHLDRREMFWIEHCTKEFGINYMLNIESRWRERR